MKKILSLVLTLALMLGVLSMLGIVAYAEESTTVEPILVPEFEAPTQPYETVDSDSDATALKPGDTFYYKPDVDDVYIICVYFYDSSHSVINTTAVEMELYVDGIYSCIILEEANFMYLTIVQWDGEYSIDLTDSIDGYQLISKTKGNFYDSTTDTWSILCEHEFADATCKDPETCTKCGVYQGEIGDHSWVEADCDTPKTCSVCSETDGEALGHEWVDATEKAPKTCSVCVETEGETLEKAVVTPQEPVQTNWFIAILLAIWRSIKILFHII